MGFPNGIVTRLREVIRRWLGLGPSMIAADLGITEPTTIVVISHVDGGRVEIISGARFSNLKDFEDCVIRIQRQYGIPRHSVVFDKPLSTDRR